MTRNKLKLEEVEIESFEITDSAETQGTVEANMLTKVDGTCRGQTGLCSACPPIACY